MDGPLKWHGGKAYLAAKIVALMPPRCKNPNKPDANDPGWLHYVEPYFGGGSVLLANDPEGISEVVNDRNVDLSNFWTVLQNRPLFEEFHRCMAVTPFSKLEYGAANEILSGQNPDIKFTLATGICDALAATSVARAVAFFVRCRQSLSGRMKGFAGITRNRTRKGMNEQVSAWLNCIDGLPTVHARLQRVLILNDEALEVIRKEDGPRTLFYLDPPYLHSTRATTKEYGEQEMSYRQHRDLLEVLKGIKGRFLLSGYDSDLYRGYANTTPRWQRHDFELPNNAAGGKTKRRMKESVWCNF